MNKFIIIFTVFIAVLMSFFVNITTASASINSYDKYPFQVDYVPSFDYYIVLSNKTSGDKYLVISNQPLCLIKSDSGIQYGYAFYTMYTDAQYISYTNGIMTTGQLGAGKDVYEHNGGSGQYRYLATIKESFHNNLIEINFSNYDIKESINQILGNIIYPANYDGLINGGVDIGFDMWTNTVIESNSIYDSSVPVIGTFKVQYQGVGALAKHLLSWATSNVNNDYYVELKAYYEFQSTKSWALKKDYNKSTFTFIDYADNYKSAKGALSFALSSSDSDNSIIAKALQDVAEKFGAAESMSGLTANDSSNSIKAYYIRNVYKASDGKYHYGRWVRCKIGDMYQASTVTEIDENGNINTDSTDYPVDSNGNPIYNADGGNISTGNSFFDTIISAIGGIGSFFATLGTMVTSLVSGIGQVPQVLSVLLSGFPPIIWSMVALGFVGVIVMRFVGR